MGSSIKKSCLLHLETWSFGYIFLPGLLFVFGWLRLWVAIPLALVLVVGIVAALRSTQRLVQNDPSSGSDAAPLLDGMKYLIIAAMAIGVVLLSGIGGLGSQVDPDFAKHNAFLRDLIEYPWPLVYAHTGPNHLPGGFAAYCAFYLPAAVAGKLFGWNAANGFALVWAFLGLYLTLAWFLRIIGRVSLVYSLFFLFYGGMSLVGFKFFNPGPFVNEGNFVLDLWCAHLAWYNPLIKPALNRVFWVYGGNIAYLYNGFHHVLPGWMIVLMTMHYAAQRRTCANVLFLWAACPLGSTFVALGMMPFVALGMLETRFRNLITFQNVIAAPLLLLVSGLYFLSNNATYVHGWLWQFQDPLRTWPILFVFYIVTFGAYAAVCPIHLTDPGTRPSRWWWWTALACLLLLPWYRLGPFCEVTAKCSIPALIVFQVFLATSIRNARTPGERNLRRILVFLLLIGACSGLQLLTRQAQQGFPHRPPAMASVPHINALEPMSLYAQFFADRDQSFFWKYMAKPVPPQ